MTRGRACAHALRGTHRDGGWSTARFGTRARAPARRPPLRRGRIIAGTQTGRPTARHVASHACLAPPALAKMSSGAPPARLSDLPLRHDLSVSELKAIQQRLLVEQLRIIDRMAEVEVRDCLRRMGETRARRWQLPPAEASFAHVLHSSLSPLQLAALAAKRQSLPQPPAPAAKPPAGVSSAAVAALSRMLLEELDDDYDDDGGGDGGVATAAAAAGAEQR